MYIKLTRLDNTPIWINASFVVTVEPRKAGGSVVVPIGDGLDYDVKETTEAVLAMLDGAPAPAVVPVPAPPGLAPKTLGVAPEAEPTSTEASVAEPVADSVAKPVAEPAAPAKKTTRARKAKTTAPAAEAEPTAEADGADKPAAKKPRARRTKKPEMPLTEDEVARLRKLAPGTVRKLQNTLVAQFRTVEPEAAMAALEAHEILSLDRDHIIWK